MSSQMLGKAAMYKRIVSIWLIVCLICSFSPIAGAGAASVTDSIEIGSAEGARGDTISVAVYVTPDLMVEKYGIAVQYDPAVLEPVQAGAVTDELGLSGLETFGSDAATPGLISVSSELTTHVLLGREHVFTLHFKIKGDAAAGDSAVTVLEGISYLYVGGVPVTPTVVTGNVKVKAPTVHDAAVAIGSASGQPGESVQVSVYTANATSGVGSYQLKLPFDSSALEVTGIVNESGDFFDSNYDNAGGWLQAAWADSDGGDSPVASGGQLFTITFKIKATAAIGDKALTVADQNDLQAFSVTDALAVEMNKTLISGKVTVTASNQAAPAASTVTVSGTVQVGQTLTGSYIYSDADGDSEGASTFKWYRSDDASGTNKTAISGAIAKTYVLQALDLGKYISFEVTPVAATGTAMGTPVESALTSAVVLQGVLAAPQHLAAARGDRQVTLNWDTVTGATYYHIYSSTVSGQFGPAAAASVTGTTYTVLNLVNGTTYYFVVKAGSPAELSGASGQASAVPATVPAAPTNVTAAAGDKQATISFAAPSDNGGSAITRYEVTSSPGNVVASGTASPITVTGLSSGDIYTFTVKAFNELGAGAASAPSASIELKSSSSGGQSSGGTSNSGSGTNGVNVLVNGKVENAGTAAESKRNEQTVTTITVDQSKLEAKLAAEGQGAKVTIPVNAQSDIVVGELNGQMVKSMESKQAVLEITTDKASYTLPARQINIDSVSSQLGGSVALQDIKIQIEIAAPTADTVKIVENAAEKGTFTLVAPPIEFTVKATYGDKTVEVSKFNAYVERTIAIPAGVDPSKITTAVVIDADGSVRHVPTKISNVNGKYFATINSLTNSVYSVVWHPIVFKDVESHWSKAAVNDMGSRMVIDGTGESMFSPDRNITRAEFAAIVVRGLGLKLENASSQFSDVKPSDWYAGVINTAYAHQLISGFEDGTFRPNDNITREQAAVIIGKAMTVTGLKAKLPSQAANAALLPYTDTKDVSSWAVSGMADSVQAGIVTGRNDANLIPKAFITRAEVAAILQRLLQKSGLI
jgi:hypothetical protein